MHSKYFSLKKCKIYLFLTEIKNPDFLLKIRIFVFAFLKWCHLELNQGHTDFQSVALPTELWHLVF